MPVFELFDPDMTKIYHCKLEVRPYELDASGHVNNGSYVSYLEFARWKMLEQEQITLALFKKWNLWPVVAKLEIQYVRPAFAGEQLEIRTRAIEQGRAFYAFEQIIYRGDTVIAKGMIRGCIINEEGRPVELPREMYRLWDGDKVDQHF